MFFALVVETASFFVDKKDIVNDTTGLDTSLKRTRPVTP